MQTKKNWFEKADTMGFKRRSAVKPGSSLTVLAKAVALSAGLSVAVVSGPQAQQPAGAAPQSASTGTPAKKNTEAALKAYGAGTRAYETGKMADAVSQLSTALTAGGLPSNQMAKALYYRGAAYRKQGKHALAISDLTSALWLKGGLNDTDRAMATDARQAAYRDAGLGDTAPAVPAQQAAAVSPSAPAAPAMASAPSPAPPAAGASVPWQQATSTGAASTGAASSAAFTSAPDAAPAAPVAQLNAAPSAEAAPVSNPLAGAGQSVSGFFSNVGSSIGKMFGSGESSAQATQGASSPVATSSTAAAAPTAVSSWSDSVVVAPAKANAVSNKAGANQQVAAAAPAAAGKVQLQVASVRSRDEAELVATRLRGTPAVMTAAKTPSIEEAVIGNMGTFYRVSLGPFASAADSARLCAVLKPEGYDCLVVAQ